MSGYFPLSDRIGDLRKERFAETPDETTLPKKGGKKWFYVHGTRDMLVPSRLYNQGVQELANYVDKADIEQHLYEGMGHSTCAAELRDLLGFFEKVIPQ